MISLLAFLFVLGVLVFVHELGHLVVARRHGVRCLTFSLGLGPKLVQTKRGDTVYCISAIPLGGYVKMAGEKADDRREGRDDEFLSKTKWQRFQILAAGPAMNIILAVVIMTMVLLQGTEVPAFETRPPVVGSVTEDSPAAVKGIRAGDRILTVAGRAVDTWKELTFAVGARANREIDVVLRRDGSVRTVQVTPAARTAYNIGDLGIGPDVSPQVLSVSATSSSTTSSAARGAGILVGDVIEAADGRDVTMESLVETLQASPNRPVTLQIRRDGARRDIVVTPQLVGGVGLVGVQLAPLEMRTLEPGLFEAFTLSLQQNYEWLGLMFQMIRDLLVQDTSPAQLAGPVGIAQLSGVAARAGWITFFGFMALISLTLGIMNLLPIPILDGGHIFIMAMEGISGRDFSVRLKDGMTFVGFVTLMTLIVTATYNDLTRIAWIEHLMIWR